MRHGRDYRRICRCSDCDGTGKIEVGRRGPNDPDTYEIECDECYGTGEVYVEPADEEEDA